MALEDEQPKIYRPALLARRGEFTAWILTLVAAASLVILWVRMANIPWTAAIFVGILLLMAASISLGNWMDRRTIIRISPEGVAYNNGLRHADLSWDEIKDVQISPSRFGNQVHVIGDQSHFRFRMHADVRYQGEVRGQLGFPDGEKILAIILSRTGLSPKEGDSPDRYSLRG